MKEYRKTLDLDLEGSTNVELGPIPGLPAWHDGSNPSRWPFPTPAAAFTFAKNTSERYPGREVVIAYPDGRRWDGKQWL